MSICCKDVVELSNQKLLVSTIIEVVCDCWKYETITSESVFTVVEQLKYNVVAQNAKKILRLQPTTSMISVQCSMAFFATTLVAS